MVCSQVYSQHPSHCAFSSVHQHRSWAPNNAVMHCREPETSEAMWYGNTAIDGHFLFSKGYASGSANVTSPFRSSWIQRLIPSHSTRVEQPQPLDKPNRDNYGSDGMQANWKDSTDRFNSLESQSDFLFYENSRRSQQEFFSSHESYLSTLTPGSMQNGANVRPFEAPDALPPEIQVSPKPLPVVESLLPGCSKKVRENEISMETNMPHILSRCTGLANPTSQVVHYSANETSRVSRSSIEGVNSQSVVCTAGSLLALKSLQDLKRCIGPAQPCLEFFFKSDGALRPSDMDPTYGGMDRQTGTSLRTHKSSKQSEDAFVTLHNASRYHESSVARCQLVERRLLNGYSMPYGEEANERLPLGLSMDQLMYSKTIRGKECWNPTEHHSYACGGSEASHEREGSFNGGWWALSNTEIDELRHFSGLVPLHCGADIANDKAGNCISYHTIEQDLGSSHSSHEGQGGTSRSFSFHFEKRLAFEDDSKVVTGKGQWPFDPSALSNEELVQSRCAEDNRARGESEAARPGPSLDNSSFLQETGVREAGTAYIGRSQTSPFFGTQNFNASASLRGFNSCDVLPYKAACIDTGGVCRGEINTQALPGISADHTVQTLKGGHALSRLESEGVEAKELMLSFPSRTVSVRNWKALRCSIDSSGRMCSPQGAQSSRADGSSVGGVNNWQAFKPPIGSSAYTYPPEGPEINHRDDNLCDCTDSIGSCSKRASNLCSEDPSTSADARSRPITQEKPVAPKKQLCSSQRECVGTGGRVKSALDNGESEGKDVTGGEALGSAVKRNVWMKRWSTMRSRKVEVFSRPNKEGKVLAGMRRARNYIEDYCTSQGSRDYSRHFDLIPAKRICYEKRSNPHLQLTAVGRERNKQDVASHFMKRFFTPSAAAMAIMGLTARKVRGIQPQRSGLFGVWALNASQRKLSGAQAEACKEFLPRPIGKKEISQSSAKAPPTSMNT